MKKFCIASLIVLLVFLSVPLSESDAAEPIRVGIADFVSRTNWGDSYYLGKINEIFRNVLSNSSSNIEVVNTQSSLSDSDIDSIVNSGQSTGCKYIVLGALMNNDTKSSSSVSGGIFFTPVKVDTKTQQNIAIDARLIDVKTGKVILSAAGTGIASYSYSDGASATKDMKKFADEAQKRHDTNLEKAILSASSIVAEKICAFLTGEYPKVSVVKDVNTKNTKRKKKSKKGESVSLGSVKIDRGKSAGIIEDAFYRIFFEGEEVFDFNGNSLGHEKFNVAIAQVKSVQTNSCVADVKGGNFANIRNDDKAEQISAQEAEAIIAGNDFANNRLSEFLR